MEKVSYYIIYRLHTKKGRVYTYQREFDLRDLALKYYNGLSEKKRCFVIKCYRRRYTPGVGVSSRLLKDFFRFENGFVHETIYLTCRN